MPAIESLEDRTLLAPLYQVNAGGPSLAGVPEWDTDTSSSPSPFHNVGSNTFSVGSTIDISDPSIPVGTPAALFQTERWDPSGGEEMQWAFPVTPGGYEVRLYFAEIYSGTQGVGQRVFDVSIEGTLVLDNYDVYAAAGAGFKGIVETFTVTSDDVLNIDFGHVVENPAIKGIEILPISVANVLGASPNEVSFGNVLINEIDNQVITLTNLGDTGDPSITIDTDSAQLIGTGEFSFSFAQSGQIVLPPGGQTSVTVTFAPTSAAFNSATLEIPHTGDETPLSIAMTGLGVSEIPISFGKSNLSGESSDNPTTLQWGPDGRLYVGEQDGDIKIYTIVRNGPNDYEVTATETITLIKEIPNHNDDGTLNSNVTTRQLTGLVVAGTATNPVIYVGSSDPRIGGGSSSTDTNLDTNSGIISRLTWNGSSWDKLDLVRGLPRSEENHSVNGMQLDAATNTLYVAVGGHTNMGAPSNNFVFLPEYALSAAILAIDLTAIGETTYDLPTLDDEDRPGTVDANDPFGGNDGKNQAILVPGGPVQIFAPGFRNPYDLVLTESGQFYTIDNGPNAGWGDVPINEGPEGNATNDINEPGQSFGDGLHYITGQGYYGGHPNPTRSNPDNTFNDSNPQSPVSVGNAIESDYQIPGVENGALVVYGSSTNGITEYTADNFGGQLQGDLLAASFDAAIKRVKLDAEGDDVVLSENLFTSAAGLPLDVTAVGDNGLFPGTIWVADYGGDGIVVFEPADFDGNGGGGGTPDDLDGDGYSNEDEAANGTDPTNAADVPPDNDLDFVSDLFDDDDDNDALLDTVDPFAIDATNGLALTLPVVYTWENDAHGAGGFFDLGFTGLMTNGSTDYLDQFDPTQITPGGAAGVLTVDAVTEGDATGATNTQEYAFQFGVNVSAETDPFTTSTRIVAPFLGVTPEGNQSMGLAIGAGDQDNYAKAVVTANNGSPGVQFLTEVGGAVSGAATDLVVLQNVNFIDLFLTVDPINLTVQASYAVTTGGVTGTRTTLGTAQSIPASWLGGSTGLAVGIISTSVGAAPPFPASWDHLTVQPETAGVLEASATELNFGAVGTDDSAQQAVVLTNLGQPGDPAIDITNYVFGGADAGDFDDAFDGQTPLTLQPGESTTVNITFAPDSLGIKSATLDIVHNGISSPLVLELEGIGNPPGTTAQAAVAIASGNNIDSSTFGGGSFQITNDSLSGQTITSVTFDLSTAILPDLVFDPNGTAGDTVAKGFTVDSDPGVGLLGHNFSGPHDNGFDQLTITFNDFDPGQTFTFSVDVDPTSIQGTGAPGPNESGSVSGLELTGSTITVNFDDGTTFVGRTFRTPDNLGSSENVFASGPIPQASIEVLGVTDTPTTVANPNQTVRVSAPNGSEVVLLIVEGGLFTSGLPNGGFDIDAFEANSALTVTEHTATVVSGGFVDIPVTLADTDPDGGINHLMAVVRDVNGRTGLPSQVLVVELDTTVSTNEAPVIATIDNQIVAEGATLVVGVSATDNDGDDITLTASGVPSFGTFVDNGGGSGTLTVNPAAGDSGNYVVTVTATDDGSPNLTDTETFTISVIGNDPGSIVYRVNAGGPLLSDTPNWDSDTAGSPSPLHNTGSNAFTTSTAIDVTHPSIPSGTPVAVFQSERWDPGGDAEMQWSFPVAAGTYEVRLYFAEIYSGTQSVGDRVFDVTIEGALVLDDYDVVAAAGAGFKGIVETFIVSSDDVLNIDFGHVVENPAIKGIEILTIGGPSNPGVTIAQSSGSTDVAEGGNTDTYTVVLDSQPTDTVAINVSPDSQLNVNNTSLVFTTTTWNIAQTVTVTAVNDNAVEGSHTGTISHSAVSGDANYDGISIGSVTAQITDNDVPGVTITQSGGSTAVTEGGNTDTYTIVLNTQPTATVTVNVSPNAQLNVDDTSLEFTTSNWNIAQTVTVSAVDDSASEGNHSGTITHSVQSSDGNYNGISVGSVSVAITDNDVVSPLAITGFVLINADTDQPIGPLNDGDTINLQTLPTTNLNVQAVAASGVDSVQFGLDGNPQFRIENVAPYALNGDSNGNYSAWTPSLGSHTLTATGYSGNGASGTAGPPLTINFNVISGVPTDPNVTITESSGSTNVTEGGATDTYTIVLDAQPTDTVTINISPDGQLNVNNTSLVFTTTNWNIAQTVTVTAVNDDAVEGSHTGTISHSAVSADADYDGISIGSVTVQITDNDVPGLTITQSGGSTAVTEGGNTDTYTVVLNTQPTATVTVNVSPNSQLNVDETSLEFTTSNWNIAQTVTVSAVDDSASEGNHSGTITHSVQSGDGNYNGFSVGSVSVAITDNDAPSELAILGFMLINADTDEVIGPLNDGDTINLQALPTTNLNVQAIAVSGVDSVQFGLDGNPNFQTENTAPFALNGDIGGNYLNWTPSLGLHTLTATGFSNDNASGTAGSPLTITFNVISN